MSRIFVAGLGAVSPAGWNVAALRDVLNKGEPLPVQTLERPGWNKPLPVRLVPGPTARPEFLAHPRLRRASPITHYVVGAGLEAAAKLRAKTDPRLRLGLQLHHGLAHIPQVVAALAGGDARLSRHQGAGAPDRGRNQAGDGRHQA